MMTKQHFETLAKTLAAQMPSTTPSSRDQIVRYAQWYNDVLAIAGVCEIFNARFDLKKFLLGAGFDHYDIERYCP